MKILKSSFYLYFGFLIILVFVLDVHAQSRMGISLSGGKYYKNISFNTKQSSNLGFDGEIEFFMWKNVSYFINSGFYSFSFKNPPEAPQSTIDEQIIPIVSGLRIHFEDLYFAFSPGFLIVNKKVSHEYSFAQNSVKFTSYLPGNIWSAGMRFNVSKQTSIHLYIKYALFKGGYHYWGWGIGLAPSH